MTGELGPSARALLDAAREGMSPDAAAIRRVRAKVDASVGGGAAGALAGKLGLVALVAAIAIGAGIYVDRRRAADAPPRIDLPSVRNETAAPVVRPAIAPPLVAPAIPPAIEMDAMPARVHVAAVRTPGAPATRRVDLAREVELIDRAMAALRTGDTGGALAAVHVFTIETRGAGQLAEDAAAIEIEALCRIHDPAVAAKLDAFDAHYPRSAQRSRLTTSCP